MPYSKIIKLERVLFYLLLFSIPFEVKKAIWFWGRFNVEWTSGFLWTSDILIIGLLVLWLIRTRMAKAGSDPTPRRVRPPSTTTDYLLLGFFAISGFSIFGASILPLAFYQLFKLAEFIGFYFYIKNNFGYVFSFIGSLFVIFGSAFIQAVIAIAQSLKQSALGLKLIGEPVIAGLDAPGVAVFFADGIKFLRAYGTTPHPNVLAAFLFVAIFGFYWLYLTGYEKTGAYRKTSFRLYFPRFCMNACQKLLKIFQYSSKFLTSPRTKSEKISSKAGFPTYSRKIWTNKRNEILMFLAYALILWAFFTTYSRIIIGLWVFGLVLRVALIYSMDKFRLVRLEAKKHIVRLAIVTFSVVILFSAVNFSQVRSRLNISPQEEAISQRIYYGKLAGEISGENPLLGVGLGQFVPEFMDRQPNMHFNFYQPVHNIYLLISSETILTKKLAKPLWIKTRQAYWFSGLVF